MYTIKVSVFTSHTLSQFTLGKETALTTNVDVYMYTRLECHDCELWSLGLLKQWSVQYVICCAKQSILLVKKNFPI